MMIQIPIRSDEPRNQTLNQPKTNLPNQEVASETPKKKKRIFQKLNEEKSSDSSERFAEEVRKSDRKTALGSSNGLKEQIFSIDLKDSIQRS